MIYTSLNLLQQDLEAQSRICSSMESLSDFPPILYQPFSTTGIGFIVCEKGSFTFSINGKGFQANANETVFFPNQQEFQILSHTNDLRYQMILYQVDPIRDILGTTVTSMHIYTKVYPHRHYVYHTGQEEDLTRYISLINCTLQQQDKNFNHYEQKLLLISLTYRLCCIFQYKMQQVRPANARRTEVFLHLIKLIDTHYKNERGVEFYANLLCLSAKYLSGLTKSICGYTVQQLVFKAIIREIKTLLNTTSLTIQEISNEFSFPNASCFGTFFKKQTGISPQKYREKEMEAAEEPEDSTSIMETHTAS